MRSIALTSVLLLAWGALALYREGSKVVVGDSIVEAIDYENPKTPMAPPERVVTASLLAEDLLLGILPEERWAGISFVVDWASSTPSSPRFSKKIPRVTGNAESILSRNPDLVVVSDFNQFSTIAQLREASVPVYRIRSPRNFDELFAAWRELGTHLGYPRETEAKIRPYEEQVRSLSKSAPPLRVLLLQGRFSYSRGSLHDGCLRHLGLVNIVGDDKRGSTPELGTEELATLQPDLVFFASSVAAPREVSAREMPAELPYASFPPALTPRVFLFPEALLGSISQHVVDACAAYQAVAKSVDGAKTDRKRGSEP